MGASIEPTIAISPASPRVVTWRSLLLGLVGVVFVCGLTPYNDYVVGNTYLVGNFLPIGLLLYFMLFIMAINAPLRWLSPRHALGGGELSAALVMVLVSCAIPSSGLMRYLPSVLVNIWNNSAANGDYQRLLRQLNLPDWIFPTMAGKDVLAKASDPVVRDFVGRTWVEQNTWSAHWNAVPWAAWLTPALTWGALMACIWGALLFLSVIVRRQWVENERLAFPLATVYLNLIEEPEKGKLVNKLLRSRLFWMAFGAVFFIHGFNALHVYNTKLWPEIPISFNFWNLFTSPPWNFTEWGFRSSMIYFSIVGIVFFLQSKVAFSLWFTYILLQLVKMSLGTYQAELTYAMQQDQMLGGYTVFACIILWIGRHHWALVVRQMFFRARPTDPQGRYLPYSLAGWGLVVCLLGIVLWLKLAGATVMGAVVLVLMLFLLYLVVARILAETGLIFIQALMSPTRPWLYMLNSLPGTTSAQTSQQSYFLSNVIGLIQVHDQRESMAGFLPQALRITDKAYDQGQRKGTPGLGLILSLILAMGVGFLVSGASMLYVEYNHASTLGKHPENPINNYPGNSALNGTVMDPSVRYLDGIGPSENHNRWKSLVTGAGITSFLGIMRLRFVNWPLHPVGYLLVYSYPMQKIWFSIMIGWLAKMFIVRFGGSTLYRQSLPFFFGLIVGEAGAAAFWLIVSLLLNAAGLPFRPISLLPG